MAYLGNAYQVSLKVREFEKRFSLISKSRDVEANQFYFHLLYKMIEIQIMNNLETGNLIFPNKRIRMTFSNDQSNAMKLYDCVKFINVYGVLKDDVRQPSSSP